MSSSRAYDEGSYSGIDQKHEFYAKLEDNNNFSIESASYLRSEIACSSAIAEEYIGDVMNEDTNLNDFAAFMNSFWVNGLEGSGFIEKSILDGIKAFKYPISERLDYLKMFVDWSQLTLSESSEGISFKSPSYNFMNLGEKLKYDYEIGNSFVVPRYEDVEFFETNELSFFESSATSNDLFFRFTTGVVNKYLDAIGRSGLANYNLSLNALQNKVGVDFYRTFPELEMYGDLADLTVEFKMGLAPVITMSNNLSDGKAFYFNLANYYLEIYNKEDLIVRFVINGFANSAEAEFSMNVDTVQGVLNVELNPSYKVIMLENVFSEGLSVKGLDDLFGPILEKMITPNLESLFNEFVVLDFNENFYNSKLGKAPFDVEETAFHFENENFIFIMDIEND